MTDHDRNDASFQPRSEEPPADEAGARPPKPVDEENSDQGKMQPIHDAQRDERGTRENPDPSEGGNRGGG